MLNGTEVQSDNRIKFTDDENLHKMDIIDVKLQDAGEWRAVVRNRLAEKALTANLNVIPCNEFRRPNLKVGLQDLKVPKESTAIFTVELTADPMPDIEWLHNGVKVTKDCITYDVKEEILEHNLKKLVFKMEILKGK